MYHSLKSGKKQRKNRRLLGACFVLAGLWAAALGLLLLGEASAAGELLAGLGLELTDQDILSLPIRSEISMHESLMSPLNLTPGSMDLP